MGLELHDGQGGIFTSFKASVPACATVAMILSACSASLRFDLRADLESDACFLTYGPHSRVELILLKPNEIGDG